MVSFVFLGKNTLANGDIFFTNSQSAFVAQTMTTQL